jgi:hypothetical protein
VSNKNKFLDTSELEANKNTFQEKRPSHFGAAIACFEITLSLDTAVCRCERCAFAECGKAFSSAFVQCGWQIFAGAHHTWRKSAGRAAFYNSATGGEGGRVTPQGSLLPLSHFLSSSGPFVLRLHFHRHITFCFYSSGRRLPWRKWRSSHF